MEPPDAVAPAGASISDDVKPGVRATQVQPAQRRSPQPAQGGAARAALAATATSTDAAQNARERASADGAAAMAATVRRLEQRLEAERRHVDRQLQRLERRVEEVACASSAGGRWAELQGHVDGLAETVQGLLRGDDRGSWQLGRAAASAGAVQSSMENAAAVASQNAALEALRSRADAVSEQVSDMATRLLDFGERLVHMETSLDHATEVADAARNTAARPASARGEGGKVERLQNDLHELTNRLLSVERGVLAAGENSENEAVPVPLWDEADGSLMPSGSEGDVIDDGLAATYSVEDLQDRVGDLYDQLTALRGELEEQSADLSARVHDAEQGLEDLAHSHEMRSQVNSVNEQVMRLALRTQRSARLQDACEEDVQALRSEMGSYSEELGSLWMRVEGSECGLDKMTGALGRVCQEVADLRARVEGNPNRSWRGQTSSLEESCERQEDSAQRRKMGHKARDRDEHSAADDERAENCISELTETALPLDGERPHLRGKVQEVERGLQSMEEVVWDLRKRISGMETRVPQGSLEVYEDLASGDRG